MTNILVMIFGIFILTQKIMRWWVIDFTMRKKKTMGNLLRWKEKKL